MTVLSFAQESARDGATQGRGEESARDGATESARDGATQGRGDGRGFYHDASAVREERERGGTGPRLGKRSVTRCSRAKPVTLSKGRRRVLKVRDCATFY
jgi:hypothetical protein